MWLLAGPIKCNWPSVTLWLVFQYPVTYIATGKSTIGIITYGDPINGVDLICSQLILHKMFMLLHHLFVLQKLYVNCILICCLLATYNPSSFKHFITSTPHPPL